MTREEQIKQKSLDVFPIKERDNKKAIGSYDVNFQKRKAFEEGAKWADKTMIARAVEWLQDSVYDRYIEMHEDNIEDFRKAMEE